jgi:hypothetical protein
VESFALMDAIYYSLASIPVEIIVELIIINKKPLKA